MREDKDRSGKWVLEHFGGSILRLGGLRDFTAWRTRASELTVPKRLPDGLLDVTFRGRDDPDPVVVEIATYPDARAEEQAVRDAMLVFLDRGVLPEVITLVLHPKGNLRVSNTCELASRQSFSRLKFSWHVVELWALSGEDLLAANDVGLVPWVPLTQFEQPPAVMLQRCRERIDQQARPEERSSLLVVSHIMAQLRYNDRGLLAIFSGGQSMLEIESPWFQEMEDRIVQRTVQRIQHENILRLLTKRFGAVPQDLADRLRTVRGDQQLYDLLEQAAVCQNLEAFRAAMPS